MNLELEYDSFGFKNNTKILLMDVRRMTFTDQSINRCVEYTQVRFKNKLDVSSVIKALINVFVLCYSCRDLLLTVNKCLNPQSLILNP